MSTQLEEHGDHWLVKTVAGPGKRRKLGRNPVRVPKDDKDRLRAEIVRQAKAARVAMGIQQTEQEPVE